jgi:hypothetical protein
MHGLSVFSGDVGVKQTLQLSSFDELEKRVLIYLFSELEERTAWKIGMAA